MSDDAEVQLSSGPKSDDDMVGGEVNPDDVLDGDFDLDDDPDETDEDDDLVEDEVAG